MPATSNPSTTWVQVKSELPLQCAACQQEIPALQGCLAHLAMMIQPDDHTIPPQPIAVVTLDKVICAECGHKAGLLHLSVPPQPITLAVPREAPPKDSRLWQPGKQN